MRPLVLSGLILACAPAPLRGQSRDEFENSPINYSATQPSDIITALEAEMASGAFVIAGSEKEKMAALLHKLQVPVESQLLVFSNTSFQRGRIRPEHPRVLYFSDNCYVGWVPGGLVEVIAIDPMLGPVFYSFDSNRRDGTAPRFVRDSDCLRCHGGAFVRDIPAVFARSVFPDNRGEPLLRFGSQIVDDHTPFTERWGGWYVSGRHGQTTHRGNILATDKGGQLVFNTAKGANVTDLAPFFGTDRYLTTGSDIVALLIFEHQMGTQNTLTHAAFSCRRMLAYQAGLQHDFKQPVTTEPSYDSVKSVFESETKAVVDALLFKDAAELPTVSGDQSFQRVFLSRAKRNADGGSLRDLHLAGRLFRNRCSYLIYSEMFLSLPEPLKRRVYDRLARVLKTDDPDSRYEYLDAEERARIVAILHDTHPELRSRWSQAAPVAPAGP